MSKFELSITSDYAPTWGTWEGLREVVQNGLDSRDKGYPLTIEHTGGYLTVQNKGCVLDASVWLLGKTSKRGDSSQRGEHGDGLKVGTLALLREGVGVKIENGDEVWTPAIERSENYAGERVLVVKTRKRRSDHWGCRTHSDFTVKVKISKRQWEDLRDRFLDVSDYNAMSLGDREILTDPHMKGRIYARGLYVCTKPDLAYGYNFSGLTLDRDRRTVDDWDLQYAIANVTSDLVDSMKDSGKADEADQWVGEIYAQLESGSSDDMDKVGSYCGDSLVQGVAQIFTANHGEKSVPVATADEATKVEFYGMRGVVVPNAMRRVLRKHFGTTEEILAKAMDSTGSYITASDMTDQERINWTKARNLLILADVAETEIIEGIRCFEFKANGAPLGTFNNQSHEIRINRSVVGSLRRTLGTMVHELAHHSGKDGTLDHRSAEETMWEAVFATMAEMAGTDWLLD